MHNSLSPAVMLATSMQAQPGVYALLLGSGVSTGAGIPTGWGVVKDLVHKVAVASDPEDAGSIAMAQENPEQWWADHHGGELGYSSLLETLAPVASARQGLLARYFEASEQEQEEGLKVPSAAHEAVAQLVKQGLVRVILTTNFDRLTERSLEAAGVSPQVIARPEAVAGMAPLAHASATVVKLHGDYLDLGTRNTPEELEDYPVEWQTLLHQVFDEYGLLVSGWSADWDTGLVAALESASNRRYPLYWDSRSSAGENARRLLDLRAGQIITADSADVLFSELHASVDALGRLIEPPLTTALAVSRLKRYLPDPVRRIDLHDLVMDQVKPVAAVVAEQAKSPLFASFEITDSALRAYVESMKPLLSLLTEGVRHDANSDHEQLWLEVLQNLMDLRGAPQTGVGYHDTVLATLHYPALLALYGMGLSAIKYGRQGLLIRLLQEPAWKRPFDNSGRRPTFEVLHTHNVIDADLANGLPRWNQQRWLYPPSHLLRDDLVTIMSHQVGAEGLTVLFDDLEYRIGLVQYLKSERHYPALGEYIGDFQWTRDEGPFAEQRMREEASRAGSDWPWWQLLQTPASLEELLPAYREILIKFRRFG